METTGRNYILVTGASSGVGREIAIQLSTEYLVVIVGRNMDRLLETKSLCSNTDNQLIWQYDLNDIQNLEKTLVEFIHSTGINIVGFVHSAGISEAYPFTLTTINLLTKMFNINTFSAVLILKTLVSKAINRKNLKSVVMISSNVSNMGTPAFSTYTSSKSALDSFMKSAAMELAPTVRVNSILPGFMRTPMTESLFSDEDFVNKLNQAYPLGLPTIKDIAETTNFLLSDKAKMITGQQLVVDGGRTTKFKN